MVKIIGFLKKSYDKDSIFFQYLKVTVAFRLNPIGSILSGGNVLHSFEH